MVIDFNCQFSDYMSRRRFLVYESHRNESDSKRNSDDLSEFRVVHIN